MTESYELMKHMISLLNRTLCSFCIVCIGLTPVFAHSSVNNDSLKVARIYQITLDIIYERGEVKMDSLLHYTSLGIRLAKEHNLPAFLSDFHSNLAYAYKRTGNYTLGLEYASLAQKEALVYKYNKGVARGGYIFAMIAFDKGDIKPCFDQISRNLEFAREHKMDWYMHVNYYLLAHINSYTNNLLITDYYTEKAFEFVEDSTLLLTFRLRTRLKKAIADNGDHEKLYKELRSRVFISKDQALTEEIYLLLDVANTYLSFGNTQKAIDIFEELRSLKSSNVEFPETTILSGLAAAYLEAKQYRKAEITNPRAIRSIRTLYNHNDYLTVLKTDALLKENKGQYQAALQVWNEIKYLEDSLTLKKNEISYLLVANLKNLESLENKFEFINKENAMHRQLLQKEKRQNILLLSIVLVLVVLCMVIYRLFRKLSVSNQKILDQNEAISQQTANLRESNMIKDKLFSLLSHELRSPVAELITLLDVNEWKNKDHALNPYFKSINLKAKILYNTLDNVLTWSASQLNLKKTEIKPLNIREAVCTTLRVCEPYIQLKGIQVENEVADAIIDANESYLMIIFRNILNNATKFTPSGGKIRLYSVAEDDYSGIVIEDSGVGIDPEKSQSLLTNIQNSSEGTDGEKGSGVGLLLCKDLVDKLHGKIEVFSAKNQGTSVRLLFRKSK